MTGCELIRKVDVLPLCPGHTVVIYKKEKKKNNNNKKNREKYFVLDLTIFIINMLNLPVTGELSLSSSCLSL